LSQVVLDAMTSDQKSIRQTTFVQNLGRCPSREDANIKPKHWRQWSLWIWIFI